MSWQAVKDLALTQGYRMSCRRRRGVLARAERVVLVYDTYGFRQGQVTTRCRICVVGLRLLQQAIKEGPR